MIPIRVLGDEEVSGVQMVFDYSGIAKQQNGGDYLSVIVLCGGILSVMIGRSVIAVDIRVHQPFGRVVSAQSARTLKQRLPAA